MIFVFGSNKAGIHGAGAAKIAEQHYGAKRHVGEGLQGNSYALPTKGFKIEIIPISEITKSVDKFLKFAEKNSKLVFKVTQVGCGLGGYVKEDIAPLFVNAPSNCWFDTAWKPFLNKEAKFWGTY